MNSPWECPRCGRMNAPFNAVCFCKPEDKKPMQHISDAEKYIFGGVLAKEFKPICGECLECGGIHFNGVQCKGLI